jgi:hypothetical protein
MEVAARLIPRLDINTDGMCCAATHTLDASGPKATADVENRLTADVQHPIEAGKETPR